MIDVQTGYYRVECEQLAAYLEAQGFTDVKVWDTKKIRCQGKTYGEHALSPFGRLPDYFGGVYATKESPRWRQKLVVVMGLKWGTMGCEGWQEIASCMIAEAQRVEQHGPEAELAHA